VARLTTVFMIALLLGACGPSGTLTVKTVQLGRSLNSDKSVGSHATRFKPDETVYASVLTDSPGSGTLSAKWTFRGATIREEQKKVSYREPAATEFHINYAGGFPPGDYRVDLELDGKPVGNREFVVAP
jgi:hypothetical protein